MAKNSLDTHIQKLQLHRLEESIMDHPFFQTFKDYQKIISYGFLLILLAIILLYRMLAGQTARTESEFIALSEASSVLSNPESSSEKRSSALNEMLPLLDRHLQLQAKYDGQVAEQLLIERKFNEASPLIERTFSRVKNAASPYAIEYAKNSILITQGNIQEGLKNAYALRENMLNDRPPHSGVLFSFNLIRIALLEKQLQNKDLELKAWDELKEMANSSHPLKVSSQEFQRIMAHFDNEEASLNSFIK